MSYNVPRIWEVAVGSLRPEAIWMEPKAGSHIRCYIPVFVFGHIRLNLQPNTWMYLAALFLSISRLLQLPIHFFLFHRNFYYFFKLLDNFAKRILIFNINYVVFFCSSIWESTFFYTNKWL